MNEERMFGAPIFLNMTTEECEKALPFTKGQWKPYTVPTFTQDQLKGYPIMMDASTHKFGFLLPKNYLK